ncbi:MAG: hypothetical protein J6Y57_11585 [Lachnospiraceae bacterium]|nr:hypothetical protein [Lachnospiraceae bacterium]
MVTIRITTGEGTKVVEAASISNELLYNGFRAWILGKPIKVAGEEMPTEAYYDFGDNAVIEIDDNTSYDGPVRLIMRNDSGEIRCYIANNKVPVLQSSPDVLGDSIGLNDISGGIGPFTYSLSIHLDTDDFSRSYFAISLSVMGVKLCNAHLDADNPKITFGTSVCGVGTKGTLGIDFNGGRIYLDAELEYFVGTKKFSCDLYNWKNYSVEFVPAAKGKEMVCALSGAADNVGGRITIENRGAYVAKFTLTYTLNGKRMTDESDSFTAGVTKSIEIPAGSSDIHLCVQEAWFISSWSEIFSKVFETPVSKKYRISGTTLNTSYEEINV